MREVVIVSGARTPVGRFGGSFKDVSAPDLGAAAIKAALDRSGISPDMVDEVVIGNAVQAAEAGYAARLSSLKSGIPEETPTIAINRQCSSGLEAINMAAQLIKTGEVDIAVAGGTENMSQVPYLIDYKARFDGLRMGDSTLVDGLTEGLGCPVNRYHMGVTAENVAERFGVSREDQDELAYISHLRSSNAISEGRFSNQITTVDVPQRRSDPIKIQTDEGPRSDTTMEGLSGLRPVFKKDGTVTAANASSINDGAAMVVMMSKEKAKSLGITPRMKWHTRGVAGVDPAIMGIGPVPAVKKAIDRAGMSVNDIDVIELNEAFAVQALTVINKLSLDPNKINVNGGAIGLGHPLGCTGTRLTITLLHEMKKQNIQYGLVSMCVGGGMGVAAIFEQLS